MQHFSGYSETFYREPQKQEQRKQYKDEIRREAKQTTRSFLPCSLNVQAERVGGCFRPTPDVFGQSVSPHVDCGCESDCFSLPLPPVLLSACKQFVESLSLHKKIMTGSESYKQAGVCSCISSRRMMAAAWLHSLQGCVHLHLHSHTLTDSFTLKLTHTARRHQRK